MIRCEKCNSRASGMVITSGLDSHSDWPVCDACLKQEALISDRYLSFLEMLDIVYRNGLSKIVPWRGEEVNDDER